MVRSDETLEAVAGPVDISFCRKLPKIELHAHLSGSVTVESLQRIWERRKARDSDFANDLTPPDEWFAQSGRGQNIKTFFAHFNTYIYRLISDLDSLAFATRSVLDDFKRDGVVYLELRTTPRALVDASAEEAARRILMIMSEWNNRPGESLQSRLILSIDRSKHSPSQAEEIVAMAIRFRNEELPMVGIDLSGDPHGPLPDNSTAFTLARQHSLPVSLHFAEIPPSDSLETELRQLLSYSPRRLGHVIHVPEALRQEIIASGIHVELLLTCNILAGMLPGESKDFGNHHFDWWYNCGAGMSIGTDDIGVFGSRLSEEYQLVSRHFGLGEKELLGLVTRGVEGIFDDSQKTRIASIINRFESSLRNEVMHI